VLIAGKKERVVDAVAERRFGKAEAALDSAKVDGEFGHMPKGLLQTQPSLRTLRKRPAPRPRANASNDLMISPQAADYCQTYNTEFSGYLNHQARQ
jgi:hypothetical protein